MTERRQFLTGAVALAFAPAPLKAMAAPEIHVLKDRGCGCCNAWIDVLAREGLDVSSQDLNRSDLVRAKFERGVPPEMVSCHTAEIGGYVIEGHVPPADIRRLLAERPDAVGLAVPGMPYGSPGMGPESQREAYDVFLIRRDGSAQVFSSYGAA